MKFILLVLLFSHFSLSIICCGKSANIFNCLVCIEKTESYRKFKGVARKFGYDVLKVDTFLDKSIRYSYSNKSNYYESLSFTIDTLGRRTVSLSTLKTGIFDSSDKAFLRMGFYLDEVGNLAHDKLKLKIQGSIATIISVSKSKSIDTFEVNSIYILKR